MSKYPDDLGLLELKFFLELVSGQIFTASKSAEEAFEVDFAEDQAPSLYFHSIVQFLMGGWRYSSMARND